MASRREKQQDHQGVQDLPRDGQVGLGPPVIHLVHSHAHLGIHHGTTQLGDVKEKIHRHAQQEAYPHLQQHQNDEFRRSRRDGRLLLRHRGYKNRQHQHHPRAKNGRDIAAAKNRVEQDKSAHPRGDEQEQRKLPPVNDIGHARAPPFSWRSGKISDG